MQHLHALKDKLKHLMDAYGPVALVTWLAIFAATWGTFWALIENGLQVESTAGTAGTIAAAYVATQATKPIRIIATLVLTPLLARGWQRIRPERV